MLNYAMQHVEQSEEKQFGDFIATLSKSTEEKKNMKLAEALELRGYEKGIKEANQKAQEKTKQVAKNLLKTISNLEYIQQVTGLDITEIQQLQKEVETV